MPSHRLMDLPDASTTQNLAKKSVCSMLERTYNSALTGPITSISCSRTALVYTSTSARASNERLSFGPMCYAAPRLAALWGLAHRWLEDTNSHSETAAASRRNDATRLLPSQRVELASRA